MELLFWLAGANSKILTKECFYFDLKKLSLQSIYFKNLKQVSIMKKILILATAAFLFSGVAFAGGGEKKKCAKGKECCKKDKEAKDCGSKEKTTTAAPKTAAPAAKKA